MQQSIVQMLDCRLWMLYLTLSASRVPQAVVSVPLPEARYTDLVETLYLWEHLTGTPHALDGCLHLLEEYLNDQPCDHAPPRLAASG